MRIKKTAGLSLLLLVSAAAAPAAPAQAPDAPSVLLVVAHPDDEAMFAATAYKITHVLGGGVDLVVVTDGSGGYRYSQLAEPIYGLQLTDETIARQYLPAIRKREAMAAGRIVGVRNYFFLDEYDHAYTENVDTVLNHVWDADRVRSRLTEIMKRNDYDYVFVHLPVPDFHGHHKAASILALEATGRLPEGDRPVVLGCFVGNTESPESDRTADYTELPGYPITRVRADVSPLIFDRRGALSPGGRLDYRIVVNWVIAEHRSQGAMQLLVNRGDVERFWFFEMNSAAELPRTRSFFDRLAVPVFGDDSAN